MVEIKFNPEETPLHLSVTPPLPHSPTMDIGFDWVLAMRIYLYVFYASLAVRLIISAFKCFLSYLRSHWTPTGLISSGLEQLEAQADLIAQIEVQRESGNPPIPPECSLGYLEALREVRKG